MAHFVIMQEPMVVTNGESEKFPEGRSQKKLSVIASNFLPESNLLRAVSPWGQCDPSLSWTTQSLTPTFDKLFALLSKCPLSKASKKENRCRKRRSEQQQVFWIYECLHLLEFDKLVNKKRTTRSTHLFVIKEFLQTSWS